MATKVRRPKRTKQDKAKLARGRIKSADETFEHLRMLIYGKNGAGKTRFGATGPKPLILDCNEKGTMTVRKFEDVEVFPLDTWSDIDLVYWFLKNGDHDRETLVIDTITSLSALCMNFVLGDEASRDPTMDPNMPSKREYGKVAQLMKTEILKFRNLPMHVVFVAQERRGFSDDEDEDAPEVFPSVSPSIRDTLTAAVDVIGRMYVKEVISKEGKKKVTRPDYRMLIGSSERFVTKDRSEANLPRVLRLDGGKDNLGKLVKRIRSAK